MSKFGLCIGINYEGTANELGGCINDAHDWATVLKIRGYVVKELIEQQATRASILSAVKEVIGQSKAGDSVIITNSSHGTQVPDLDGDEPDRMDEATCSYDLDDYGLILDDEWWKLFRSKAPGVQIAFFSDSCHSGTVARRIEPIVNPKGVQAKRKFIPWQQLRGVQQITGDTRAPDAPRLLEETGWLSDARGADRVPWPVLLMAGCQDDEYSYDAVISGRPNGAFTAYALRALKSMPAGATFNDWFLKIRQVLPNRNYPQTPRLIGSYLRRPVLFG